MLVLIGGSLRARDETLIARIGRSRLCIASRRPVGKTTPDHTLRAFADHGEIARTLDADPDAA